MCNNIITEPIDIDYFWKSTEKPEAQLDGTQYVLDNNGV